MRRFDNRVAQWLVAAWSAMIAVIGLAEIADPSLRVTGVVVLTAGVFFTARALRSSSVLVDESGVATRSIVRTRRYTFSQLSSVEVAVGRTGLNGFGREYLIIHCTDGRDVAFKEVNCKPRVDDRISIVRTAAAYINSRLPAQ